MQTATVVGLEFHPLGKIQYFLPGSLDLRLDDQVVAQTLRGLELGRVVEVAHQRPTGKEMPDLIPVLRRATTEDLTLHYRNRLRAQESLVMAKDKVHYHGLDMKLLSAEWTLDGQRVIFYFAAEGRVDFRQLVRDLAAQVRKRIELYQVGARDRAKLSGGLGPCGRECCCSSWLREFVPVSVKMTKDQGLSLNPQKISGSCGRLMCCLRYEYETYRQLRREYPRVGSVVRLPEGKATVLELHLMRGTITVQHDELGVFDVPAGRALLESPPGERCQSCSAQVCDDVGANE